MFSNNFISKIKLLKKPFNLNKIDDELLNLIEKEKLRLPHLAFENTLDIIKVAYKLSIGEIDNSDFKCIGINCNNFLKLSTILNKHHTCSRKCASNNEKRKEKVKQTCLKRYGVENGRQVSGVTEKIQQTCLERYGVTHHLKDKNILKKLQQTCLEKYGVTNVNKMPDVKEKFQQTCLKRYGVDNPSKSKEIRAKANNTNLQRYGVSNLFASKHSQDHSKKTRLENSWKIANSFKHAIPMFTKEEFNDLRKTYLWKCTFCRKYF